MHPSPQSQRRAGALGARFAALVVSLSVFGFAAVASAKDFRVKKEWTFPVHAEGLVAASVDFADSCQKGCRHPAPHLAKGEIIAKDRTPNSFYVWMFIEDVKNSKWFSQVTIRRSAHGAHVELVMVPDKLGAELAKASGLPSEPAFDDCRTSYDFEEVSDGGTFSKTLVTYSTSVALSGLNAFFGGGVAQSRLEETSRAIYQDLLSVRP